MDLQRDFIVGGSWLYYKIYTGYKSSDKILVNIITPIVNDLKINNLIIKWFFIRYADPHHHIRLRIHIKDINKLNIVISSFRKEFLNLLDLNVIWKVQVDTYSREIERYGANTMEISEKIFYYDSKMIVDFISLISGEEGEKNRWLFSMAAIDSFLVGFGYDTNRKKILLNKLSNAFEKEFNLDKKNKNQISKKYRFYSHEINNFMSEFTIEKSFKNLLNTKERKIYKYVQQILIIEKSGKLNLDIDTLMSSYIHMLMNRLFKSKNRLNEMVVYNFMLRYYKSVLAKNG